MSKVVRAGNRQKAFGRVTPSRLRRNTVFALGVVLAFGAGSLGVLVNTGAASAAPPTPGWTSLQVNLASLTYNGESCASAFTCVAVGSFDYSGSESGLMETLAGGSWVSNLPVLPNDADLDHIGIMESSSCPTESWCAAAGNYDTAAGGTGLVVDGLSGGNWVDMRAPLPFDSATGSIESASSKSIDCTQAESCVVVGSYSNTGGGTAGFIDTLAGGHWSSEPAPQPPSADAKRDVSLYSVSCSATGSCSAVGFYENSSNQEQAEILQQASNGTWSVEDAPLPGNAGTGASEASQLLSISCQAGFCEAAGLYEDSSGNTRALLENLSGAESVAAEGPQPSDAASESNVDAVLYSVSCAFDGCVAVGSYSNAAGGTVPLVDTVTRGGAASATTGPLPSDAATGSSTTADLTAVSCLPTEQCTAVGSYLPTSGPHPVALIDESSAGTWSNSVAPLPGYASTGSSAASVLSAVSCSSGGACGAAGDFQDITSQQKGVVMSYTPPEGYYSVASDGGIFNYGSANFHGSRGGQAINAPMVGMAATPGNGGYWEVGSDGGIFTYGNAAFYGSTGSLKLNAPIVGMSATPDGAGYWLVASDGGIFTYGNAAFYGSTGSLKLNAPIVGMAATPDGAGYWLVASDGGIFTYGDAGFYGSRGGQPLNKPIVGMAADASGLGYWLVASDGGIFNYGDAGFYGSRGGQSLNKPIVDIMSTFDGAGYWLVASDGGIFSYGDAGFYGSAGSIRLNAPVVSGTPS